jgi:hypothetical protein
LPTTAFGGSWGISNKPAIASATSTVASGCGLHRQDSQWHYREAKTRERRRRRHYERDEGGSVDNIVGFIETVAFGAKPSHISAAIVLGLSNEG